MAPKNGGFEWQPEASEALASLLEVENTHAVIRSEPECPLAFVELFASDGEVSNGKYFFLKIRYFWILVTIDILIYSLVHCFCEFSLDSYQNCCLVFV